MCKILSFFAERSNAVLLLWILFAIYVHVSCFFYCFFFFFFFFFFFLGGGGGSVVVALFSRPFVCRESAGTITLSHLTNYIFLKINPMYYMLIDLCLL